MKPAVNLGVKLPIKYQTLCYVWTVSVARTEFVQQGSHTSWENLENRQNISNNGNVLELRKFVKCPGKGVEFILKVGSPCIVDGEF